MDSGLASTEFDRLMARCGPFEPRPLLAVAVSGGGDSMALALLADGWARARKGRIVALTVDHGLRPEARAEARRVARRMKQLDITHRTLVWRGAKPQAGVQEAARAARYRLLGDACEAEGALHLLIAHTRDDQAETVLLRLTAGSGPHGLAAMPIVSERPGYRLVRPLLGVPRARLRATLRVHGQDWIEDPSNSDERFARIRVRRALARGGAERVSAIPAAADQLGRFRAEQERAVAATLARAVRLFPEGYARLDPAALADAPPEIGWRTLAALLATVGGLDHPPRGEPLRRLHADLVAGALGRGRTLGRCRIVAERSECLVLRETRGFETLAADVVSTRARPWDGRYTIRLQGRATALTVGPLGAAGWAELVQQVPKLRKTPLPHAARLALPALSDRRGLIAVPALGYLRAGSRKKTSFVAFQPLRPLAAATFAAPEIA